MAESIKPGKGLPVPNNIIQVTNSCRHVIAGKLLAELDTDDSVAVLLKRNDVDKLIGLLEGRNDEWSQDFLAGLKVLRDQAFS